MRIYSKRKPQIPEGRVRKYIEDHPTMSERLLAEELGVSASMAHRFKVAVLGKDYQLQQQPLEKQLSILNTELKKAQKLVALYQGRIAKVNEQIAARRYTCYQCGEDKSLEPDELCPDCEAAAANKLR